ncbi:hypothetical protein ACTWPB_25530 [Nocardia sp. IBHARD005]|uniref:hypothetical protein n=1 Tax=Nocardia sp. IBHARD005 TaxID=3457765 RepID=UPI004057DA7C
MQVELVDDVGDGVGNAGGCQVRVRCHRHVVSAPARGGYSRGRPRWSTDQKRLSGVEGA